MVDIQKVPLKDKIASVLMQRVIDGDISQGDKLREAHLAKEFGVSQAPVREAIITLVAKGILEHIPNVGTKVKKYSKKETIEIYQAREALELYACDFLDSFTNIDVLESEYQKILNAVKESNLKSYVEHDQYFHELLLRNTNNYLIVKLWREQYTKSSVLNVVKGMEFDLEDVISIHEPMIRAIKKGSINDAKEAVRKHYSVIVKEIKES